MRIFLPGLAVLFLLFAASCATTSGDEGFDTTLPPPPDFVYYEFDDVAIPRELDRDDSATFIVESPPLKSGVMVFDGSIDRGVLVDFFIQAMPNNGWSTKSLFKAPRALLVFEKGGRYCVISVSPGRYLKNQVEIWVTAIGGGTVSSSSGESGHYGASGQTTSSPFAEESVK